MTWPPDFSTIGDYLDDAELGRDERSCEVGRIVSEAYRLPLWALGYEQMPATALRPSNERHATRNVVNYVATMAMGWSPPKKLERAEPAVLMTWGDVVA